MDYIDFTIIILYLMSTLAIGLYQGRYIKSIEDYSIGGRNYTTPVMVAAIFATVIGGASTLGMAEKVFNTGLIFLLVFLGAFINKVIIAYIISPRMKQFENMISMGDMMGKFYGKTGKVITGISGTCLCIGILGSQISAMGYFIQFFLDVSFVSGIFLGCGVVVIYSSLGGIRAVTITDVIQFSILIVAIPMICNVSLNAIGGYEVLLSTLPDSHMTLIPEGESIWKYIGLILTFSIPFLDPSVTQRLLMSRNTRQMTSAMMIAAWVEIPFYLMVTVMGLIAVSHFPNISGNVTIPTLINEMLPVGLKGITIAGILAVIMSTADSVLNAASVTFVHDVIKPVFKKDMTSKFELNTAKWTSFILGTLSIIIAFTYKNVFDILLGSFCIWGPVILVPLYGAIFNLKASPKTFILSILAGISCFFAWNIFSLEKIFGFEVLIPSVVANGMVFFSLYFWGDRKMKS